MLPYVLGGIIIGLVSVLTHGQMERKYQEGFQEGRKTAYNMHPVSEELEMTCASLWVGEQNKKAYDASTAK
jgi:hypothetical protein